MMLVWVLGLMDGGVYFGVGVDNDDVVSVSVDEGVCVGAGIDDDVAMGVDDVAVSVSIDVGVFVGVGVDDNAVVVNVSADGGV